MFRKWALPLFMLLIGCGSKESQIAGFTLELPDSVKEISLNSLKVTGSVWSLDPEGNPVLEISPRLDADRTNSGNYGLRVANVPGGIKTEFRLEVRYRTQDYEVPGLASQKQVTVNQSSSLCPFSLTPDTSIASDEDGAQWMVLCEVRLQQVFVNRALVEIPLDQINCKDFDADGDEVPNVEEIDLSLNPFEGDFDGDCVPDREDVFPKDAKEFRDTNGNGIGDRADTDIDGDGLSNAEEQAMGTDPVKEDTDGDGIKDREDNCPLENGSQSDTDKDGIGDICDADSDNDGLTNQQEKDRGTDPINPDTDGDGLTDGDEVSTNPLKKDSDGDGYNDKEDAFPVNSQEFLDTDGDGVGDNADLCPTNISAENEDSDSDRLGNACDADDDNDGISDMLETKIGSNPLNPDSDGDGLKDWFGGLLSETNRDPCLLIQKTTENETGHNLDIDNDGFGSLCDCKDDVLLDALASQFNPAAVDSPDTTGTDLNCDGVDGDKKDAVFVDPVNGNDSNNGSFGNPKKTLSGGLGTNKPVYALIGSYELTSTLSIPDGGRLYGGYSTQLTAFDTRAVPSDMGTPDETNSTKIHSKSLSDLILVEDTKADTVLDGVTLVNEISGGNSTGVVLLNSKFTLKNSVLKMGKARHVVGMEILDSSTMITNNRIELSNRGTSTLHNAYGILADNSSVTITDTRISISDFGNDRWGIACEQNSGSLITLSGLNHIDLLEMGSGDSPGTASSVGFIYLKDCDGDAYTVQSGSPLTNLEGFRVNVDPIVDDLI